MRFCFSATAVTDEQVAEGQATSDSEERRVNPLLYAVAVSVQPTALPGMAGPRIAPLSRGIALLVRFRGQKNKQYNCPKYRC